MENNKVAINLVTWNGQDFVAACLDSALSQTYQNYEILIVDNGSIDGTPEFIKKKYPQLRLIENDKNLGFAAGHNLAIKNSDGEFILCLNQDVILDKNFLQKAVEQFKKDGRIGAIQAKLLRLKKENTGFVKTGIIDTTGLLMLKNRRIVNRTQGLKDTGQFSQIEEVFGADGAAPLFRRVALAETKLPNSKNSKADDFFDEDFFSYKEDVDLAWRLRLYGWKIIYLPDAIAWHARGSGDSAAFGPFDIIRERRKINDFSKSLSFANQRLMQLKNEQWLLLLRDSFWFVPKEVAAWIYVLIFEKYNFQALKNLLQQLPAACQKRKIIKKRTKVGAKTMAQWFK
jgi:GT2 family glycosyltransferase